MKLNGKFVVDAPRTSVWEVLNEPETLAHLLPGAKSVERVSDDEFTATMSVGIGPIRASFSGKLEIVERNEPDFNRMRITGDARQGRIVGDATVTAVELAPDRTEVSVDGEVQVGGMIARVGQRMLGGKSQQMMQQFFRDLSKEAAKRSGSNAG